MDNFLGFKKHLDSPASKLGVALIFFRAFVMFNKLFFSNSIKTLKVLVDTTNIINSLEKLLKSKFTACFFTDHSSYNFISHSSESTLLGSVFEKSRKNRCLFNLSKLNAREIDLTSKALFVNPFFFKSILSSFVKETKNVNYFISDPVIDQAAVNYYRIALSGLEKHAINKL